MHLRPDGFRQLQHGGGLGRRKVEVVVERRGVEHGLNDAACQVGAVGVVAHLRAIAEDVHWILTLEHLLDEVGNDMAHRQLYVPRQDLFVAECSRFANADAVERSHDRVRQSVLLVGSLGEVLDGELLKAVRREWRRNL